MDTGTLKSKYLIDYYDVDCHEIFIFQYYKSLGHYYSGWDLSLRLRSMTNIEDYRSFKGKYFNNKQNVVLIKILSLINA